MRNRITVNVIFSEIVDAAGTVLHTSWGDLNVRQNSDSLSNVVSYSGYITADVGTRFRLSGIGGTVKDLKGNQYSGTLSKLYTTEVSAPLTPQNSVNGYMISCLSDFYWYADRVAAGQTNTNAILTNDITIPDASMPEVYPMGGTQGFTGNFNGDGHKIKNLTVKSPVNGYLGLFSKIAPAGAVRNLTLENAEVEIKSLANVGGICGENKGTIRNCMALKDSNTVLLLNRWKNMTVGGIAAKNSGSIEGCLFYGLYGEYTYNNITRGAVCGSNTGSIVNCVGLNNNKNYFSGVIGADSGTSENNEFLDSGVPFSGGQACYILNGGVTDGTQTWYQTIGTDDFPCFDGETVYKHGNKYVNEDVHEYEEVNWVWAQDYSSAILVLRCTGCDYTENVTATVNMTPTVSGLKYTATAVYNGEEYSNTVAINDYFNITFKDYDGSTLVEILVAEGAVPVYPSAPPENFENERYVYSFEDWDPPLAPATEDAVYTATYTTEDRYYTVNFYNYDGTLLQTGQYTYGSTVNAPVAQRPSDGTSDYVFEAWSGWLDDWYYCNSFTVTDDADYYAEYSEGERYYTIQFVNTDGTVLYTDSYFYGDMPEYPEYWAETPTMESDDDYSYSFSGWIPEITEVTEDVTYVANYTAFYIGSEEYYSSGDYIYTVDGNGNAQILEYTGVSRLFDIYRPHFRPGIDKLIDLIGEDTGENLHFETTSVEIPETLDGHTVNIIRKNAFRGKNFINSVKIPDTVISIGENAFYGCTSLDYVETGTGLEQVLPCAFASCHDLEAFIFKTDSLYSFAENAFDNDDLVVIYGMHDLGYLFEYLNYPFIGTDDHTDMQWFWNGENAILRISCDDCGIESQDVEADVETVSETPATCTTEGSKTLRATVHPDYGTFTDEQTVEIFALGHDWGEPVWTWNGTASATAVWTCQNDSTHTYTKPATVSKSTTPSGDIYTASAIGPDDEAYYGYKYDFPALAPGKNTVSIPDHENADKEVLFVPAESGRYRFYSVGNENTGIEIYCGDDFIAGDDEYGLLTAIRTVPLTNGVLNNVTFSIINEDGYILGEVKLIILDDFSEISPYCTSKFIHKYDVEYSDPWGDDPNEPYDPDDPEDPPEEENPDE